jgi:hypothetical protein
MVYNDTTNKNGIIQTIEFWTNLGDASISGDTTLLKVFTARINEAFDRIMPLLLSFGTMLKWDDANNTDLPVATFNAVSGQGDYTIAEDGNSLDILNITDVKILPNATSTFYSDVEVIGMDDYRATWAMSPATTDIGTPTCVLKRGNTLFFFPKFNYNATSGIKIFFEREQSYFASSDTTKEPGIPKPFHGLLPLYAAYDWLVVNKPGDGTLITRLEAQIHRRENELRDANKGRFPARERITSKMISFR